MHLIFRVIKFALQTFWRNIWLSLITITVLVLALLSINFIIIFNYIADSSVQAVKDKIDISVYFKKDISETEIYGLKGYLESLEYVKEVTYNTPQAALESFRERHRSSEDILSSLDELDENPISASLVITANNVEDYEEILNILSQDSYENIISTTSFDDYREIITKINLIMHKGKRAGYVISAIFIIIGILIIINTVRVSIYTHREEIGIMKLVGAGNMFVRAPFILENVMLGIISLCIAIGVIYPLLSLVQMYFGSFFGESFNITEYFYNNFVYIFGLQLLAVVLLNMISSGLAVGKYLKV